MKATNLNVFYQLGANITYMKATNLNVFYQ